VEGRLLGRRLDGFGLVRAPGASLNIGENVAQLGLGSLAIPAILGPAEGDVTPLAVGAEADRPTSSVFRRDDLSGCSAGHQA
jgi:hypothetical protein